MRGAFKKEGDYELFETTKGNQVLNLEDKNFYALVEGQKGDIIVYSDSDHKKKKSISKGKFYYVDFKNDPEFNDMPHLFMEDGKKFRELVLPEGLPTTKDKRRKLVRTSEKIPQQKVIDHVKGSGDKGSLKKYEKSPEGLRNKTKEELYELAKQQNLKGRSKMDKQSLVRKLSK